MKGMSATRLAVRLSLLLPIAILLLGAACTSGQTSTRTPSAYSSAVKTPSATTQPRTGSKVTQGIISDSSGTTFSVDTDAGRLVLTFDKTTVVEKIDPKTFQTVSGPLNLNDLPPGTGVQIEYFPTDNLAAKIVISGLRLYNPVTGDIDSVINPSIYIKTVLNSTPGERIVVLRLVLGTSIIVRNDGTAGNIGDLSPGTKIRAFCFPGSANIGALEIQ